MWPLLLTLLFYQFLNNVSSETKPTCDNLKAQVHRLENTVADLQTQAQTQEKKYRALVSSIKAMAADVKLNSRGIKSLETRYDITEQHLDSTTSMLKSTVADTMGIAQNVTRIGQVVSGMRSRAEQTVVAFQVSQTAQHVGNWTTLIFDTVDTNAGVCYNSTSGMFKTPISGIYLFWVNVDIYPPDDNYDHICIMTNTTCLAMAYSETAHGEGVEWTVASAMTVITLQQDAEIYFAIGSTESKIGGGGESSYGGALLQAAWD